MTAGKQLSLLSILTMLVACTPASPDDAAATKPSPSISPETSASYVVRPDRVPVGVHPRAVLTNTGISVIEFGDPYEVERFDGGRWRVVRQPPGARIQCVFTSIGRQMEPGGSWSQRLSVCDVKGEPQILYPGRYRVSKRYGVGGAPLDEDVTVTAEFRVTPPCGSAEIPDGVNVSERQAIATAFPNRRIADCSRFEATLDISAGRKTWNITLLPKGNHGCTQYRGTNAITGEKSPGAGEGCP